MACGLHGRRSDASCGPEAQPPRGRAPPGRRGAARHNRRAAGCWHRGRRPRASGKRSGRALRGAQARAPGAPTAAGVAATAQARRGSVVMGCEAARRPHSNPAPAPAAGRPTRQTSRRAHGRCRQAHTHFCAATEKPRRAPHNSSQSKASQRTQPARGMLAPDEGKAASAARVARGAHTLKRNLQNDQPHQLEGKQAYARKGELGLGPGGRGGGTACVAGLQARRPPTTALTISACRAGSGA